MRTYDEELDSTGQLVLRCWTSATINSAAILVTKRPGPGKPFWSWPSVPSGRVIGADFSEAPLATADPDENLRLIQAITAKPEDVLEYAPPA
jgi:hypothetical protein